MTSCWVNRLLRCSLILAVLVALPLRGYAQEATITGTISDTTGAVLPGVVVRARHIATGNTFEAVTDTEGVYRIAARTGAYELTAQLQGFTTVVQGGLELLLGQQAVLNLRMEPSALQETITVSAEAPLVDASHSTLGSNIDPRQLSELPVNGRNWVDLVTLAAGSRSNAVGETPIPEGSLYGGRGAFQLNVDGQQVTQTVNADFGQPDYSRDSIAEFQFVSNRFDASQGRTGGVQVNAITKSGTNAFAGSFSGYFRDDRFNSADFVRRAVLPYSNQQLSSTFGGPIRKDRIHFFANYEYEREPQTYVYTTPYPRFNASLTGTRREHKGGVRTDVQFSPANLLTLRVNAFEGLQPYDPRNTGGSNTTPAGAQSFDRHMRQAFGTFTRVLSSQTVNQLKAGYGSFGWAQEFVIRSPNPPRPNWHSAVLVQLRSFTVGPSNANSPQFIDQHTYSLRDDLTHSVSIAGRHDLKLGGEYLHNTSKADACLGCFGTLDVQGGPVPTNIEARFPDLFDASTWNLNALSPIARSYTISIGSYSFRNVRQYFGGWIQDDWALHDRITVNLGLRYDLGLGIFAEDIGLAPFLTPDRPVQKDRFAPRLGFAYTPVNGTVVRGGFGKYYADPGNQVAFFSNINAGRVTLQVLSDGRPDFAGNPFNGPAPATLEEALRHPGLRRSVTNLVSPDNQVPYSYQTSIGVQQQLGDTIAVQADYVYTGIRHEIVPVQTNLTYNQAAGVNYPFSDLSRRAYPDWGVVNIFKSEASADYHGLQTAFTKRFSQRWQASATYTLSRLRDQDVPAYSGASRVPFAVAPDLGGDSSLSVTDQRHRAVFNGIWQLGYGFQLSGLYFYGSGYRFGTTYGGDLHDTGGSGGRLRPNGTIVPRNGFVGNPVHRVDLRFQRTFPVFWSARIDGILEVFNAFNHENFGSYTTAESNANYGRPTQNTNVAYQPRMLQLGFRFTF